MELAVIEVVYYRISEVSCEVFRGIEKWWKNEIDDDDEVVVCHQEVVEDLVLDHQVEEEDLRKKFRWSC